MTRMTGEFGTTPLYYSLYINRLRVVPIFPLEFVEPWKDIAKTGARNPGLLLFFLSQVSVRDVFPRLDELKRKNMDCSQSIV